MNHCWCTRKIKKSRFKRTAPNPSLAFTWAAHPNEPLHLGPLVQPRYRFIRVQDGQRDQNLPTMGFSAGFFPATVMEEYNGDGDVLVKFHGFFDDPYGPATEKEPVSGLHWRVPSDLVLERSKAAVPVDLSLVVVRWQYYWTKSNGSPSHNILNEKLIKDVLDGKGSFKEYLGKQGNYEVFTIFASTAEQLNSIQMSELSGLRGKRKAALYFLWPTQKPMLKRDGLVSANSLGSLMQRMEAADIKTCWPHPYALYYDLVSKSWAPRECTRLEFNIPPTTLVSKEDLSAGPEAVASAAASAIEKLQELSRERGETPPPKDWATAGSDKKAQTFLVKICRKGEPYNASHEIKNDTDSIW